MFPSKTNNSYNTTKYQTRVTSITKIQNKHHNSPVVFTLIITMSKNTRVVNKIFADVIFARGRTKHEFVEIGT
jgi:hypothetical protein